jgi:dTDP-4-dehydrorhamnose 3,5-epimerase
MSVELTDNKIIYIPKGFAHGFSVLSEQAFVQYKVDNFFKPEFDSGLKYNDPSLNINWGVDSSEAIISDKDNSLPYFDLNKHYF